MRGASPSACSQSPCRRSRRARHQARLPALSELDISGNQVTDLGGAALLASMADATPPPPLRRLDLSGNPAMGAESTRSLARLLHQNPGAIEEVRLGLTGMAADLSACKALGAVRPGGGPCCLG